MLPACLVLQQSCHEPGVCEASSQDAVVCLLPWCPLQLENLVNIPCCEGCLKPVLLVCTGDYKLRIAALASSLLKPLELALTVRSCASGEVVRTDTGLNRTQCVRCQPGTYTFNSSLECRICSWDDYAECDGAARVPMPGFYQSHPRNPQVCWPC